MICVDQLFTVGEGQYHGTGSAQATRTGRRHAHQWCHLWSATNDLEELHAFAKKLAMSRSWFQNKPGFPHYDLVPTRRSHALSLGAVECSLREWMQAQRKLAENRSEYS